MIITVTMNPAIDKTAEVPDFVLGGVNKLGNCVIDAGGKGVNVSKTLRVLNKPNMACGFVGGATGEAIKTALQKQMIMNDFIQVEGETRCNLKVKTVFGMTEMDEPGPKISAAEMNQLTTKLQQHAKPGTLFVLCGSIPEGVPEDIYGQLTDMLHRSGCKVFLDAGGEALKKGLDARPEYVKPNLAELEELYGHTGGFDSKEAMIDWVKEKVTDIFNNKGCKLVVASLGSDGAVFCDGVETLHVPAKAIEVISPVGAGDAMTAAIAYGIDSNMHFRDIVRYAIAVSGASCMSPGTKPPTKEDIVKLLRMA